MPALRTFRIVPAPLPPILALVGGVVAVLAFSTGVGADRRFPFVHPVLAVVNVGVLALLGTSLHGSQRGGAQITPRGVRLVGDLYGRRVTPWSALRVAEARVVDLHAERALRLGMRIGGTGFPGYGSGWFTLEGGGRALCLVSLQSRVVVLPTTRGWSYLLSLREPDAFLAALQAAALGGTPEGAAARATALATGG